MSKPITENKIETFAIKVLQSMGWEYMHGLAMGRTRDTLLPKLLSGEVSVNLN
ncbi:MAG: hypothetical protein QM541_00555 [Flavobacterium sp.]|nr:hypothetical protein [Flavobacterium sp.]